jgi:hypothetical protein
MAGGPPSRSLAIDTSLFLLVVTYKCLASGNARDRVVGQPPTGAIR